MAYSPQDVYARHLVSRRGYPLWTPEPNMNLPDVYVREGLKIGDVGVVVPEDETGVPDNFTPILLSGRDISKFPEAESAGRIISTSSVARVRDTDAPDEDSERRAQPGPLNYEFTLSSRDGAVLILPEGAERYYLRNERLFMDQAIQHAVDWYNFAEQRLGRIISHDSLYLITGFYKARSWSLAAYQQGDGAGEASAQFKAVQVGRGNASASYTWETTRAMDWRAGPSDQYYNGIANQTVFIQGFKIAVRGGILGRKRVNVKADFPSVPTYRAKFSSGSWFSNLWGGISGSSSGSTASAQAPNGTGSSLNIDTVESNPPVDESDNIREDITIERFPQVTKPFHPSDIINQHLLREGLLNHGELSKEDSLIAAVKSNYSIALAYEGAVYLRSATTLENDTDNETWPLKTTSDLSRSAKFPQPITPRPPAPGYRQTVPISTQDVSQVSKRQPNPQRPALYPTPSLSSGSRQFPQPITPRPPAPGYRQTVPISTQDVSQVSKKQSNPQRPALYPTSSLSSSSRQFHQHIIHLPPAPGYRQTVPTNTQDVSQVSKRQSDPQRPALYPASSLPSGPRQFHQPILPNPLRLAPGYRQIVPTNTQDVSQVSRKQSYSRGPALYPASSLAVLEGSRGIEPTLSHAIGQLAITTHPRNDQTINAVLFGEPGVGKSAVINLIAGKNIARVPSGVHGCTLQSTRYDTPIDDINFCIFETVGLEKPEIKGNDYLVALEKAYEFVHELGAAGGVHLLLFCIRADRLTATTRSNYRFFSEVVFPRKVPLALIITGLEGSEVEDWWTKNKTLVARCGLKSDGHACITTVTDSTLRQNDSYAESQKRVHELLKTHSLKTPASLPEPHDWFLRLVNGMQQFIDKKPTRVDIMNTLTMRLKLDPKMVKGFQDMMDRGDAQDSSRGGDGGPQGASLARVKRGDWEGEVDLPKSNMTPRSQDLDTGKRSDEPQRAGLVKTGVRPWDSLDSGKQDNEPPRRRATGKVTRGVAKAQSRYSNAAREGNKGGKWEDGEMTVGKVKAEPRKVNAPTETYVKSEMGASMEDIRINFSHDLTGYVTRSNKYPFASGSYGDVYKGKISMKGKSTDVAIKVYKVHLQRDENLDETMKRFHREITVWFKLQHPNVLQLFGTIKDPNMPAVVCPWVENGALSAYLERNKDLPTTGRLILVNDVAHGLQYLHSQRVIHGDLSGSNVLVHADGRACIADFGLSKLLTAVGGPAFAQSRQNKGTVRWMAPELFEPDNSHTPSLTTRSDVYSFGSIMLQTLTGNIPYHHLSRDEQVIYAIWKGERPDRSAQKAVTNDRWKFIQRCWSVGEGRPSSDEIVDFTRRELAENTVVKV